MEKYEREILLDVQKQITQIVKDMAYLVGKMEGFEKQEGQINKNTKDINDVGKIARENRGEIKNTKEDVAELKEQVGCIEKEKTGFLKYIITGLVSAVVALGGFIIGFK